LLSTPLNPGMFNHARFCHSLSFFHLLFFLSLPCD
jgi:hypothetical protein